MRVNFLDGLAVAACHRSGSAGIGVGHCSVLRRAPARRLAYLHADDAGDADVNAGLGLLGALCGGRRHFIGERRNRKNRGTSCADRDFAQNLIVIVTGSGPCANNPKRGLQFLRKMSYADGSQRN